MKQMRSKPVAIKDVIEKIIEGLGSEKSSEAKTLSSSWARAIGEENVRHARPVEVKNKTLIVHIDSSGWLHKLTMEKARLLKQIQEDLGEGVIEDIKMRIGAL